MGHGNVRELRYDGYFLLFAISWYGMSAFLVLGPLFLFPDAWWWTGLLVPVGLFAAACGEDVQYRLQYGFWRKPTYLSQIKTRHAHGGHGKKDDDGSDGGGGYDGGGG